MRAFSEVSYDVSTFSMQRGLGGRLDGVKVSMRSDSVHVCVCWVDAPLTTRVTLSMMHFDGREVAGRSGKSSEVPHVSSTYLLSAKGSRDASLRVESTRAWRFCGCVRAECATPRAHVTREITHLDGRAVGFSAPPKVARVVWQVLPMRAPFECKRIPRCLCGRVGSTHAERFCGCGRGRATPGPYSARDGAFGWASGVVRPRVARAI